MKEFYEHDAWLDDLESAKLLEKAGFEWITPRYHGTWKGDGCNTEFNYYKRPTLYVVQRWFREVKHIGIIVDRVFHPCDMNYSNEYEYVIIDSSGTVLMTTDKEYEIYEDALSSAIKRYLIEIVEKEN